jgi:ubiquinol-cytochrome c reductase cytochrome c1 subunit
VVTEQALAEAQAAELPIEAAAPVPGEVAPAAEEEAVATAEADEAAAEAPVAEEAPAEPVVAAVSEPAGPAKPQIRFAEEVFREVGTPPKGKKAKARSKPGREEPAPVSKVKKAKKLRRPELEEELNDDLEEA